MEKNALRGEFIAKLPHGAKIAFAARCARIVWDLLSPYEPYKNDPNNNLLSEGLSIAEEFGENPGFNNDYHNWVKSNTQLEPTGDMSRKAKKIKEFQDNLSTYHPSISLFRAVKAALLVAISKQGKHHELEAAKLAHAAYTTCLNTANENKCPKDVKPIYLEESKKSYDRLKEKVLAADDNGNVAPVFFTKNEVSFSLPSTKKTTRRPIQARV